MNKKSALLVAGAVAVVASAYFVRKLLERDDIRGRLGLPPMEDKDVDVASSDSFPASDPPSFTKVAA